MSRTSTLFRGSDATATRRATLAGAVGAIAVLATSGRPRPALAQATPAAVPPAVERWAAAWNAQDPAAMAALFTDDGLYEDLAFGATFQGKDGVAEWVTTTSSFITDARVDLVAAYQVGARATAEWIFSGSVPGPAGADEGEALRAFSVRAASLFELEGDLIRHVADYYNPNTVNDPSGQASNAATPPAATPPA
jgi:steroid delta-isomerase-like uncharacterized protein